jgi:sterol desaturase/sphingolipid hydroxylase (fatty acid hydroxylase superfamily)
MTEARVFPDLIGEWGRLIGAHLLRPESPVSLTSLGAALVIAAGWLIFARARRGREVTPSVLMRALFAKRLFWSRSARVDIGYVVFGLFFFGLMFGWALITYNAVTMGVISGLKAVFGPAAPSELPDLAVRILLTVAVFLAYEFAYWLNHYLSHHVPFLWAFHKVHHDAEVLSPLTVFRVHPVDTIVFYNMAAVSIGVTYGTLSYAFGSNSHQFAIGDTNVIMVAVMHLFVHLQHTHLWIPFTGWLGRVLMSPAHHQVHHSVNPAHFNRNMGNSLAIWDWMFGTLYVPSKKPERLVFGNDREAEDPHTVHGSVVAPLILGVGHLVADIRRRLPFDRGRGAVAVGPPDRAAVPSRPAP